MSRCATIWKVILRAAVFACFISSVPVVGLSIPAQAQQQSHQAWRASLKATLNRASKLHKQRKYAKALVYAKRARAQIAKRLGRKHKSYRLVQKLIALIHNNRAKPSTRVQIKTISEIHDKARAHVKAGEYAKALPLAKKTRALIAKRYGRKHKAYGFAQKFLAKIHSRRFIKLYEAGKFDQAEPHGKQALDIWKQVYGPNHLVIASTLDSLAAAYNKQGRKDDAERLFKRSLKIRIKRRGPKAAIVATSLNNLANHYRLKKPGEAERLYLQALAIREKTFGSNHLKTSQILRNLGIHYLNQKRYKAAEPFFKRALTIREKGYGPDHKNIASSLDILALLYKKQARYSEAKPLSRRALKIREKAFGPDHLAVATNLDELAKINKFDGNYDAATRLFKRSAAIREKALGPNNKFTADNLHNVSVMYFSQGLYAKAIPLLKRSLALKEKLLGPDDPSVAVSLNNLANNYQRQSRPNDAEPLYKRAIAIQEKRYGPNDLYVAMYLNGLAALYYELRRFKEAEPFYKRALAIRERKLGPDHPQVSGSFNNLALLYEKLGRLKEAESFQKRALVILEKMFGPHHPDVAKSLSNLADLYRKQRRYDEAEPLFKRSLAIAVKTLGSNHPAIVRDLGNLALLHIFQRRYQTAFDLFKRSAAIQERRIYLGNMQGKQSQTLSHTRRAFTSLAASAWYLSHNKPDQRADLIGPAFRAAQLAGGTSAGAALGQMAVRFGAGNRGLAQIVRQRQDLAVVWQVLDKNLLKEISAPIEKRDEIAINSLRDKLSKTDKTIATLNARLAEKFPEFTELSNPKPLEIAQVQKLLKPDEALLRYLVMKNYIYLWAVTRDQTKWQRVRLGSKALEKQVSELRRGLDFGNAQDPKSKRAKGDGPPFNLKTAYDLYHNLLGPVEELLKGKKHLLIVPSGALTSLPFHLLVTQEPEKAFASYAGLRKTPWLVKRYAHTVLPAVSSLRALRVFSKTARAKKSFIGYGDPIFHKSGTPAAKRLAQAREVSTYFRGVRADLDVLSRSLPQLPDTANELKAIAKTLGVGKAQIVLGQDATEAAVKKARLSDYRIIHFATHGLVAGDVAKLGGRAEPALALSLPNKATDLDDGLLTASEVAQLKLNADWVILSACDTAAGNKPGAEALSGLARSFFYAGARSMLVSHWPVASDAAVKLTTRAFAALKAKPDIGRAEAMRQSMLALINDNSKPDNAHPVVWAPFVVVGEGAR